MVVSYTVILTLKDGRRRVWGFYLRIMNNNIQGMILWAFSTASLYSFEVFFTGFLIKSMNTTGLLKSFEVTRKSYPKF